MVYIYPKSIKIGLAHQTKTLFKAAKKIGERHGALVHHEESTRDFLSRKRL